MMRPYLVHDSGHRVIVRHGLSPIGTLRPPTTMAGQARSICATEAIVSTTRA